jgi:hypothetical protein
VTPPTFFLLFYMALTGQKEASFYDPVHNQSHYALVSRDDQ